LEDYLRNRIQSSLIDARKREETPYLPEKFLFLNKGLYIWRDLVHHPKYYQTHDEMQLFHKNGEHVADYIQPNSPLIDMGSGSVEHPLSYRSI
jgi:uncharacterized SAM-dependent methyltransferase